MYEEIVGKQNSQSFRLAGCDFHGPGTCGHTSEFFRIIRGNGVSDQLFGVVDVS